MYFCMVADDTSPMLQANYPSAPKISTGVPSEFVVYYQKRDYSNDTIFLSHSALQPSHQSSFTNLSVLVNLVIRSYPL